MSKRGRARRCREHLKGIAQVLEPPTTSHTTFGDPRRSNPTAEFAKVLAHHVFALGRFRMREGFTDEVFSPVEESVLGVPWS
mgnify:CR=1 FL=1